LISGRDRVSRTLKPCPCQSGWNCIDQQLLGRRRREFSATETFWFPEGIGAEGCIETGIGTDLSYSGGPLTAGSSTGTIEELIEDISVGSPAEEIEELVLSQLATLLRSAPRILALLHLHSLGMTEIHHVSKVAREYLASQEKSVMICERW
jgi:hypothetical protein